MAARECMHDDCPYAPLPGKRKCRWHDLLRQPMEVQIEAAEGRRAHADEVAGGVYLARVAKENWPPGERWCAGCQGLVPLFYCNQSRCKAHAAAASHEQRLKVEYGIDRADYLALLELQGGVCFICRQVPRTKRLAVDHDHATGAVRGLLCADAERGCNHAVLGSLEARAVDSAAAAALRIEEYLEDPPFARLQRQRQFEADGGKVFHQVNEDGSQWWAVTYPEGHVAPSEPLGPDWVDVGWIQG